MCSSKAATYMPPEFAPVIPYITVDDPDRLLAFVKAAFGAAEIKDQRVSGPDGKTIHAAFRVEGCAVETGRASADWKALPVGIHLYVSDVDATYTRALKAAAESLQEVQQMEYGERGSAVRDPCGKHWYIATYTGQS